MRLESMPDTIPRGDCSGLQIYPVFGFYPVDGSSCDGSNLSTLQSYVRRPNVKGRWARSGRSIVKSTHLKKGFTCMRGQGYSLPRKYDTRLTSFAGLGSAFGILKIVNEMSVLGW